MKNKIIKISVGKSRNTYRWTNEETTWADLVERCKDVKRTPETAAEYERMSKAEKGTIKDVGGFVGGYLRDGIRKKGNIKFRSLLIIDADEARKDFWAIVEEKFNGVAAMCFSTHSHTDARPRLRLIMPFDRDVRPAEYEPISRRLSQMIGMDQIDGTTHDINRLFYWPSASADAPFFFKNQEGAPLNADAVLATYENWQDPEQWPVKEGESAQARREISKAADPLTKTGVVGAFCRCYSIVEAIAEFLPDIYADAGGNRYTYKAGTSTGGALTYRNADGVPDVYLYSHHDTDPAGQKLHNAFDLVRIHKFGHLDKKVKPNTPVNKLPSYNAMVDFCINDSKTKLRMIHERAQGAAADFADVDTAGNVEDWRAGLDTDKKGNARKTLNNINLIFLHDEVMSKTKYNACSGKDEVYSDELRDCENLYFTDGSAARACVYIEKEYGLTLTPNAVFQALAATAAERLYNPIKEFITSAKWDGVCRVESLLIDYLGAVDNDANREITRKWMIAAVARVFEPGRTFQNVLTLPGPQGIGKSHFLKTLAGHPNWFCDGLLLDMSEGQKFTTTEGAWIIEIAELGGIGKAEWGKLKNYLSRDEDRTRQAYGRTRTDRARTFVFAATTNDTEFLREADKGNRRWWIVPVAARGKSWPADPVKLAELVAQIWAEAYKYYSNGETLDLSTGTARQLKERQWEYSEDAADTMPGEIEAFLAVKLPIGWDTLSRDRRRNWLRCTDDLDATGTEQRREVCAVEYLWEAEGMTPKNYNYGVRARKFNKIMQNRRGWTAKTKIFGPYGKQRGYTLTVGPDEEDDI